MDRERKRKREGESWTAKSADDVTEMLLNFALLWVSPNERLRRVLADLYFGIFSFIKPAMGNGERESERESVFLFSYILT